MKLSLIPSAHRSTSGLAKLLLAFFHTKHYSNSIRMIAPGKLIHLVFKQYAKQMTIKSDMMTKGTQNVTLLILI